MKNENTKKWMRDLKMGMINEREDRRKWWGDLTLEPLPNEDDKDIDDGVLSLLGCFKVTGQTVNYLIEAIDSVCAIYLFEEITGEQAVISEEVPYPATNYAVDDLGPVHTFPLAPGKGCQ